MSSDIAFGISDQGLFGSISSILTYLLSFLRLIVHEIVKYGRILLQQLWRDPERTVTFMLILGALVL
ncbi:MAG: hypothetical protein QXV17_06875 [Candidatus Micrarchaeaceae archaeon]